MKLLGVSYVNLYFSAMSIRILFSSVRKKKGLVMQVSKWTMSSGAARHLGHKWFGFFFGLRRCRRRCVGSSSAMSLTLKFFKLDSEGCVYNAFGRSLYDRYCIVRSQLMLFSILSQSVIRCWLCHLRLLVESVISFRRVLVCMGTGVCSRRVVYLLFRNF